MVQPTPVIKPAALCDGDTVAVVAPASNLKTDYLARGVAELERLGFRARYEPGILDKARYTAGDDRRRAAELTRAFADPDIKAVWAARGGYGSMRLFDLLNEDLIGRSPKIFIGYSDMTALSLYFYRRFGWVTFHGPMAAKDLAGGEEHYDRETLIAAMMGAPDELDTRGSILFLEDTATRPYAIDRMLQQLKLAGKFDGVRGIVFGEMTDCVQNADQGYRIQDVLAECTADINVPVMFGLPSGHSPRGNLTLPLGVTATLDADRGALSIDEAAVE